MYVNKQGNEITIIDLLIYHILPRKLSIGAEVITVNGSRNASQIHLYHTGRVPSLAWGFQKHISEYSNLRMRRMQHTAHIKKHFVHFGGYCIFHYLEGFLQKGPRSKTNPKTDIENYVLDIRFCSNKRQTPRVKTCDRFFVVFLSISSSRQPAFCSISNAIQTRFLFDGK